jgi:hypothetical protein
MAYLDPHTQSSSGKSFKCLFIFAAKFLLFDFLVLYDQGSSHLPHPAHCQLYINPKFIYPEDDSGIVCLNHEKFSFFVQPNSES